MHRPEGSPTTTTPPADRLSIRSLPNLRDVGGHPTRDGRRLRRGLLYRSTALNRLDGDDAIAFARLGVRAVYDLRTGPERRDAPDRLPDGTEYVVADVIGNAELGSPAQLNGVLGDPAAAVTLLGDGRGTAIWTQHYRDFVGLPSARAAYGRLFGDVAREAHRPALFHCSTGKDRTGWASAAFLLLMGVPDDIVMEDYLLSERLLKPVVARVLRAFEENGGDADLLRPVFGVQPAYLAAGVDEMQRRFGSIESYFTDGLGVDPAMQQTLREAFIEA
jgi:protein-tyrosine phosphatase